MTWISNEAEHKIIGLMWNNALLYVCHLYKHCWISALTNCFADVFFDQFTLIILKSDSTYTYKLKKCFTSTCSFFDVVYRAVVTNHALNLNLTRFGPS